jgi:hypothetical protein
MPSRFLGSCFLVLPGSLRSAVPNRVAGRRCRWWSWNAGCGMEWEGRWLPAAAAAVKAVYEGGGLDLDTTDHTAASGKCATPHRPLSISRTRCLIAHCCSCSLLGAGFAVHAHAAHSTRQPQHCQHGARSTQEQDQHHPHPVLSPYTQTRRPSDAAVPSRGSLRGKSPAMYAQYY